MTTLLCQDYSQRALESFRGSPALQGIPSVGLWELDKVGTQESLTHGGGFRADVAELASAELVTSGVVHWVVVGFGIAFVLL